MSALRGRVFHVVDTLRIGGAERMAVDLSNTLSERGWDMDLVATRELGPLAGDVHADVRVTCLERAGRFDLAGLHRFRRLVGERRPAVVHAHGWSSLQFCTVGLLGLRHAPALVFHDHRGAGLPPLPTSYRLSAWPLASAHVAVDRALIETGPRTRRPLVRAVVPNGVPLGRFAAKERYELAEPPRLVCIANLRAEKDHPVLFAALARLAEEQTPVHLDLVGAFSDPDYTAACRRRISALGLTDVVHLLGPREDVGELLATYDLGVLSSRVESGPIALIEYLTCGLPFVVTEVGEIPTSLPEDLRQWVVPPADPNALAAKLRDALALPADRRAGLGGLGREFAEQHLSIERTVEAIEAVYGKVMRRSGDDAQPGGAPLTP